MENEMNKDLLAEEEQSWAAEEEVLAPVVEDEEENIPALEEEVVLPEEEPKPAKKKSVFKIVLISVIATFLVIALGIGLTAGVLVGANLINLEDMFGKTETEGYAVSEKDAPKMAKKVVATAADAELTNGELQAFYKANLYNLQSQYGYILQYYYGVDLSQPLDTLIYDEATGQTWQEFILESALSGWHEVYAMNMQAKEEGFQLNAEQEEYLATLDTQIQEMATASGYETVAEMLAADVGITATEEGFRKYLESSHYYNSYYTWLLEQLAPTQEQIDAYFTANEESLAAQGVTKETCTVDVRHILIQPEGGTLAEDGTTTVYSEEEWEACRVKAQEILDAWKAGEATEDSFAELAKEHSADGNASEGGLYTDVTEGYMVETFNDWIFDKSREFGNVDLVKTEFGYHVMFFVGREYTWGEYCSNALLSDSVQYAVDSAKAKFPMEVDYSKIVLS